MNGGGISTPTKVCMYLFAGIIHCVQSVVLLIPFGIGFTLGIILNPVLTLCAVVIFGLWFASRGVNIFSGTSMKGTLVSVGMGLVGLGALIPFLFVMVYSNIKKAEEAENAV